nr:MAG TPA: hypothetical protein [Bacteriophage sp.]
MIFLYFRFPSCFGFLEAKLLKIKEKLPLW